MNEINSLRDTSEQAADVENIGGPGTVLEPAEQPVQDIVKRKAGRPPGAKNKETLFKELMTGEFQDIAVVNIKKTFEVLFEKATSGDLKAIKMVLDRVVPVTKAVDLSDMEKKGLVINISVGSLEDKFKEPIEDAEFEEIE